jgi:hypothetical protein
VVLIHTSNLSAECTSIRITRTTQHVNKERKLSSSVKTSLCSCCVLLCFVRLYGSCFKRIVLLLLLLLLLVLLLCSLGHHHAVLLQLTVLQATIRREYRCAFTASQAASVYCSQRLNEQAKTLARLSGVYEEKTRVQSHKLSKGTTSSVGLQPFGVCIAACSRACCTAWFTEARTSPVLYSASTRKQKCHESH